MASAVMSSGTACTCLHGAVVTMGAGGGRALTSGREITTQADFCTVAGCPAVPPCVSVQWTTGASRVLLNGSPVVLHTSVGLALSAGQDVNGIVVVGAGDERVLAN